MEAYLDECLSSMIMEDASLMEALEVIVVNDGSKDNSLNIALSYKERYPNTFVVIDKENGNYGSCVNRGLMEATGKYFRIVDADDWVDTVALAHLITKLNSCNCDMVLTEYSEVAQSEKKSVVFPKNIEKDVVISMQEFSYKEYDAPLQMHGTNYRTQLIKDNNLYLTEGVSYTDTEYCFYPLSYVKTFIVYDLNLYQYRVGRIGQTMSIDSLVRSTNSMYIVSKRMLGTLTGNEDLSKSKDIMRYQIMKRILHLYYNTNLVLSQKNETSENKLREMHSLLINNEFLMNFLEKLNVHRIRYVRVWEKTGLYNTSICFRAYNSIYEKLLKIHKRYFVSD